MLRSNNDRLPELVSGLDDERPHTLSECDGMIRTRLRTDGLRTKIEMGSKETVYLPFPPGSWGYVRAHIVQAMLGNALRYVDVGIQPNTWEYFTVPISHILRKNSCKSIQPEEPRAKLLVYLFTSNFGICPFCCFPVPPSAIMPAPSDDIEEASIEEPAAEVVVFSTECGEQSVIITALPTKAQKRRQRYKLLHEHMCAQQISTVVRQKPIHPPVFQVEILTTKIFLNGFQWTVPEMDLPSYEPQKSEEPRLSKAELRRTASFLSQCGYKPKRILRSFKLDAASLSYLESLLHRRQFNILFDALIQGPNCQVYTTFW